MRKPAVLITGANGEIGHALIAELAGFPTRAPRAAAARGTPTRQPRWGALAASRSMAVAALDVNPLDPALSRAVQREYAGSILDRSLLERILAEFEVDLIFHLAALLSSRSEFTPTAAHHVNVEGTLNLLEFAQLQGESHGRSVVFVYPSSIAAYGIPDLETRTRAGWIKEDEWNVPITMYGCNKLYCEHIGRYYAKHYKQLSEAMPPRVDFRAVRFPGLISAVTVPSGGMSDYASEMIHCAARGESYTCFVRPDTRIPFMAMPDAIASLLTLSVVPRERLTRTAYNVSAFNPTADEIRGFVTRAFPQARIGYQIDPKRQAILDSWPEAVDDSAARRDWGFAPAYDMRRAFDEYLVPTIRDRYSVT